jgi:hypothetical protein
MGLAVTPLILDLGGEWPISSTGHFIPVKEQLYPLNRGLGGPQNLYGRFGEEKKSPVHAGIRTPDRPAPSLVTGHTMLTGANEVGTLLGTHLCLKCQYAT